jgi:hypothetical protein
VCADIGWCNDHPIKDHADMTTKPNEPEAMDHEGRLIAALDDVERAFKTKGVMGRTVAIMAMRRHFPANPVADAGGVTDADREAYLAMSMLPEFDAADVRAGLWDKVTGVQAFACHRLHSVAAATAAKDAEIAELAEAVRCIMARCEALEDEASNGIATTSANVRDDTHEAGFWRGQKSTAKSIREHLHDMTRAALSEAREAGDSLAAGDRV